MSGVRTGTRLEQLEQLRDRIEHEIAAERRKLQIDPPTMGIRTRPDVSIGLLLSGPRASAAEVRRWAKSQGIAIGERGRVPEQLHAQYEAQRIQAETRRS